MQTRARVSLQFRVQLAAIEASHVEGQILLVQIGDMFVLVLSNKDEVALRTEITLHIKLSLEKLEDVLGLTLDGGADRHEVGP